MTSGAVSGPPGRPHSMNIGNPSSQPYPPANGFKPGSDGVGKGSKRVLPHINDLVSVRPDLDIHSPIRRLLLEGDTYSKQADTHLDFRRPDLALQEYIKASVIAVDLIPRHKDFPALKSDRGDLHRLYGGLQKRITSQHAKFEEVKESIKQDNARTGVLPKSQSQSSVTDVNGSVPENIRPTSAHTSSSQRGNEDKRTLTNGSPTSIAQPIHNVDPSSIRQKPLVQPKPDALHGRAINRATAPPPESLKSPPIEDLASRFARLRGAGQDPRIRTQPITIPETAAPNGATSTPTKSKISGERQDRPFGPRDMPQAPSGPVRLQKLALEMDGVPSMPRPPDAIYSPSRETVGLPKIDQSQHNRRSSYASSGRSNSIVSLNGALRTTTSVGDRRDYFSPAHTIPRDPLPRNNTGPRIPDSSTVTAEELVSYINRGSHELRILLVDIRPRSSFDGGHIMFPSIICVEPIVLREGISADELANTLILSPEPEQKLYAQRHEFDLVVYYNQYSTSNEYKGPTSDVDEIPLRDFSRAVWDYGYDKKLKRKPMLLLGGLDAWIDLLGPNSLATSQTHLLLSPPANRNGTKPTIIPDSRSTRPTAQPARRRTYESRPLTEDEEHRWAETLSTAEEPSSIGGERDGEAEWSYIKSREDFLRRFPEPSPIQESMTAAMPKRKAPHRASVEPEIPPPPSRPAPAARPSFTGGNGVTGHQATTADQPTSWDLPKLQLDTISHPVSALGETGLQNLGNTCYMNSAIQALSATPWFPQYLLGGQFDKFGAPPKKEGETSAPPQLMVRNLAHLFRHIWNGQYAYVTPKTLRNYIFRVSFNSSKDPNCFGSAHQHDAQEFLNFLIEIMQDETNLARDRAQPKELSSYQIEKLRTDPIAKSSQFFWQRFLYTNRSPLVDRIFGQTVVTVNCRNCHHYTRQWNDNWPMIQVNLDENRQSQSLTSGLEKIFNAPESLEDYKCDGCHGKNFCTRDYKIARCPSTLIIHLVRQKTSGGIGVNGYRSAKIRSTVEFNPDMLDLTKYFINVDGVDVESLEPERRAPFKYHCYAVIQHEGGSGLTSGHYWTIARDWKNPGRWLKFDDSVVTEVRKEVLQREQTYILFFQRT